MEVVAIQMTRIRISHASVGGFIIDPNTIVSWNLIGEKRSRIEIIDSNDSRCVEFDCRLPEIALEMLRNINVALEKQTPASISIKLP